MTKKKTKAGKRAAKAKVPGLGNMDPVLQQTIAVGARLDRGTFEIARVENPHGEVIIRGEMRRHKVVRRVPRFETLYRTKVIDRNVFAVLDWYWQRLGLAQSGLVKCQLDTSGRGGGTMGSHAGQSEAAMAARSDITWARGFIPDNDLRRVFDGVMGSLEDEGGDSFEMVGARVYMGISADRAKRKASSAFKIAANHLLAGIGAQVLGKDAML